MCTRVHKESYPQLKISLFSVNDRTLRFMPDEEYDRIEKEWKQSLSKYSLKELIEIYPKSIPAARRAIKARIKAVKSDLSSLSEYREIYYTGVINKMHFKYQADMIKHLDGIIEALTKNYERNLRKHLFELKFLENTKKGTPEIVPQDGITDEQVVRAKEIPIKTLVPVNQAHKAVCLFHKDKNPSMHIYEQSKFYCFVCNKYGDVIDIYMQLMGVDFKTAVRTLAP